MTRDMDLIRQILFRLEGPQYGGSVSSLSQIEIEERSEEEVNYHVKLLGQAGLIEALVLEPADGTRWIPTSLTWQGHEFLDAARNQNRWDEAKTIAREKAGSLTFDILKTILTQLARQAVGL